MSHYAAMINQLTQQMSTYMQSRLRTSSKIRYREGGSLYYYRQRYRNNAAKCSKSCKNKKDNSDRGVGTSLLALLRLNATAPTNKSGSLLVDTGADVSRLPSKCSKYA